MVQCKWCKKKVQGNNYYLLKLSGRIIAHFCGLLCFSGWAHREWENYKEARRPQRQQAPLLEFYDHESDTSTKKEVIEK